MMFDSERGRKAGQKSKRKPLDEAWRDKLEEYKKSQKTTLLDDIFHVLEEKAKEGNLKAIDMLLDRSHGKAKQEIDLKGDVGMNIIYAPASAKDL